MNKNSLNISGKKVLVKGNIGQIINDNSPKNANNGDKSISIEDEISLLIQYYQDINQDISEELTLSNLYLEMNRGIQAVFSLTKVIENVLKTLASNDNRFQKRFGRNTRLVNLITYAEEQKLISKEEFHFLNGIRGIRNKVAHEINPKFDKNFIHGGLLSAIAIVNKIKVIKL